MALPCIPWFLPFVTQAQDVIFDIGTLGTGQTVEIRFEATINEPFPAGFTSVMNQATISGSNSAAVVTDDPGTTNVGDATTTVLPPDLDFGDAPFDAPILGAGSGTISGETFEDVDGDGMGDIPMTNVLIELFLDVDNDGIFEPDGDDRVGSIATIRSGPSCVYSFTGLPEARYFVREEPVALDAEGLLQTAGGDNFPGGIDFYTVEITAGSPFSGSNNFGNFFEGSVGGTVFEDPDSDGFAGVNPPLAGALIQLYEDVDDDGMFEPGADDRFPVAVEETAGDGTYQFMELGPGVYFVGEDSDDLAALGLSQTDGGDNFPTVPFYTVAIDASGEVESGNDFADADAGPGTGVTGTAFAGAFEDNDSIPTATPTGLDGTGSTALLAFVGDGVFGTTTGDYDFFDLDADAGDTIRVTASAGVGSGLDTVAALYDAAGSLLASNHGYNGSPDSVLEFTVLGGGSYVACVFGAGSGFPPDPLTAGTGGGVGSAGDYEVSIEIESNLSGPFAYPTLLAGDGARHVVPFSSPVVFLGATVDVETNGLPDVSATGDDLDGVPDDEDGVMLPGNLVAASTATVSVAASTDAVLNAWIDFDMSGMWDAGADQIFSNTVVTAGVNQLDFAVPASVIDGVTYARFRLSTATDLLPTGEAPDGEVEDYQVSLITAETTVELVMGDLVITDIVAGGKDDELVITVVSGTTVSVIDTNRALGSGTATVIGTSEVQAPLTSITGEIRFDLVDGMDLATVDFSGGPFGVNVVVDGGGDEDQLIVAGGPTDDIFSLSGDTVQSLMNPVMWTNVEAIAAAGQGGDDLYRFQPDWGVKEIIESAAGGSDTMDFSNVSAGLIATVNSIEVTDGVNTALHAGSEIESLITGSGSDQIFVEAYGNVLSVDAGGNGDQVTVGTGSLDGLAMDVSVDGGASLDLLFVRDGTDADAEAVALSDGLIDRTPAASVIYTNFEVLEVDLNGDQLSGTFGDGPGGLLLATLNLAGDTELAGDTVIESEATVVVAAGGGFSGTGSLTNLGAMVLATNDIEFGASLTLAGGGLLTGPASQSLTLRSGGDFTHESGNPNNDFIRGGITFTGTVAHALNVDAADQGPGLGGFTTGNRAIGVLDLQDDATVNGTVYIWEIRGDGDLTIPAGSTVYYGTTADWTGSVVGSGDFVPIVFGFTAFESSGGTDTLEWESMPGFTSEIAILSDLLTGMPQVITGFVGTATTESLATPSDITNRTYQLRLLP